MADADFVITGTVLTVDDARPTAEALAVNLRDLRPADDD
jgi:predicted amidohydrolase YtcJ